MMKTRTLQKEFLLSEDDRLAYEPLKNEKHQEFCQQIMQALETHRCK